MKWNDTKNNNLSLKKIKENKVKIVITGEFVPRASKKIDIEVDLKGYKIFNFNDYYKCSSQNKKNVMIVIKYYS